ncbi:uncharacterized protein LOC133203347 [Saccostrea echinata]|uniref:uncharacterized protein LOC133203347 n=1 Tax=Saccostrea echinata TaxID=191078 RepID=UPI002A817A5B|nr:uncharacterized protein LOC133203347 [Saccostrea echinata]
MTADYTSYSNTTTIAADDESVNAEVIIYVVGLLILLAAVVLAFVVWRRRKRLKRSTQNKDQFSTLTDEELSVLFCFMCCDSGPPDFTDSECLHMLNKIRKIIFLKKYPVNIENAQQTMQSLCLRDSLWVDQTGKHLTKDIQDEIIYHISCSGDIRSCMFTVFSLSSFNTAHRYLRSRQYKRKPREQCILGYSALCDSLLIRRLQMNILTHVTMEDTEIFDEVSKIVNIPMRVLRGNETERQEFLEKLKQSAEYILYKRSQESDQNVKWVWKYGVIHGRPEVVRSCIGLHEHWDIYIMDNKAHRKPSKFHTYPSDTRCLLYSLLLVDQCTFDFNGQSYRTTFKKLRERYFKDMPQREELNTTFVPEGIIGKQGSTLKINSDKIRHEVMYAFVTECMEEESDLIFFLKTASRGVVSEYCRSWKYEKLDQERCLYIPDTPDEFYDLLMDKLQVDILVHSFLNESEYHSRISKYLNIPEEILDWDYNARCRYVESAKKGTQTIQRARAMIVGCAGAGKTTLLKRLQNKSLAELRNVRTTVGLEVHEDIFEVLQSGDSLKALTKESNKEGKDLLSVMDFGGQCAYYACHQVYLSRRAFYILVIDMSKPFKKKVDEELCDQEGTMFSDWTYGEYLSFWMKSVHIYCDEGAPIILVGTHLDYTSGQTTDTFFNTILEHLRFNQYLTAHLNRKRCFLLGFKTKDGQFLDDFSDLKNCIASIAKEDRWKETIPVDWALCEITLRDLRLQKKRIISKEDFQKECFHKIKEKYTQVPDILKFFHEIGIILNFKEKKLSNIVIIDIQWFVDAFKYIITDLNHVTDNVDNYEDWRNFSQNGYLTDKLLERIWSSKDLNVGDSKREILKYMQRLGLIVKGNDKHYIPCMNKCTFEAKHEETFKRYQSKTSVLVFKFPFLPYFIFCRLIVACITKTNGEWKVLNDQGLRLFKNVACFAYKQHNVALAVNHSSIQLQVFQPIGTSMKKEVTLKVRDITEELLNVLTKSFHKEIMYTVGYQCSMNEVFREYDECFVEETAIHMQGKITCPRHILLHPHILHESDLLGYWKQDCENDNPVPLQRGDDFIFSYEEGIQKFNFKAFDKLTKVGRDALQIYFDKMFTMQDLVNLSATKEKVKKTLRLNDDQYALLFPADNSNPSSENFDVTMMYGMLRNLRKSRPTKGWGKIPDACDTLLTDDVERIRFYRNKVGHATTATSKLRKKELEEKGRDLTLVTYSDSFVHITVKHI